MVVVVVVVYKATLQLNCCLGYFYGQVGTIDWCLMFSSHYNRCKNKQ